MNKPLAFTSHDDLRPGGCAFLKRACVRGWRIVMARGMGYLYKRSEVWWLALSINGKRERISSGIRGGSPGRPPKDVEIWRAQKLLEVGRVGSVALSPVTVDEAADMLVNRYKAERRPTLAGLLCRLKPLREAFGHWKARDLTTDRMLAYAVKRRDVDGIAIATVNLEMGILHRALVLALESGRLESFRRVPRLPGANVRQGSIDAQPFAAILERMPPCQKAPARFLRLTGWRANEALALMRHRVDRFNKEILLGTSKTGEPRTLPYGTHAELAELLDEQEESAKRLQLEHSIVVTHLFHYDRGPRVGRPITYGAFYWAWHEARKKAGFPGAIPHDLRRTMVRTMEREGVSRSAGMRITGHRSESAYRRYAVVERSDLLEAMAKLSQDKGSNTVVSIEKKIEKTS